MAECIFCKIINKKLNFYKIYEDKKTLCILDINPVAKGHCLIIPKKHFADIYSIEGVYLSSLALTTKKVSLILKKKLNAKGVNVLHASGKAAQQSVSHFHIHIVPRYHNDGLDAWVKSDYKEKDINSVYDLLKNK